MKKEKKKQERLKKNILYKIDMRQKNQTNDIKKKWKKE